MSLIKDSSKVLSGITIQRVLSLLMVPVIARLYGPKDYGVFQIGVSICAILSIAGSLAMEASIAVSDSRPHAASRTFGASILGLLNGLLFWVILYGMKQHLERLFSGEAVTAILLMSPIVVPLQVFSVCLRNYAGYLGRFGFHAVADVLSPIANYSVLMLSYFMFWKDYRSLILGAIVALVFRIIVFLYGIRDTKPFIELIHIRAILRELWKARDFAKFYLPSNFLNRVSEHLPIALIALVFPANVVGLFTMARRIIAIPGMLTGQALGRVFYPKAAKGYRENGEIANLTWQTFTYSCRLALFPAFFIAASSGFVLPALLGAKWNGVAPYVVLLLPMVVARTVETPVGIGFIFSILNRQNRIFIGNVLLFLCRFVPLILCLLFVFSPYVAVFGYSMGSAIGYSGLLVWIFVTVSISVRRAFYALVKYSFIAILCSLPIILSVLHESLQWITACLIISVVLYGLFIWFSFLNANQRSIIISRVSRKIGS